MSEAHHEFENEKTGRVRLFPEVLFEALTAWGTQTFPPKDREQAERRVIPMLANWLDTDPRAKPLWDLALVQQMARHWQAYEWLIKADPEKVVVHSVDVIRLKLARWAEFIFARYGHPVYLVGGALRGTGRDVDIRVFLPKPEYDARFPNRDGWALEVGKQGIHAALLLRGNVDFQIQDQFEAAHFADHERVRLDRNEYPEGIEPPKSGIGA